MNAAMIEVDNFTKKFGDFTAVNGISFQVKEGSLFAFLGPNGAGKTTTISALCTMLSPTSGRLVINGHDAATQKAHVRKDIGIVFQDSTLDANLSVAENLQLHCDFYQVPRSEVRKRIDYVLELVDLTAWRKAPIKSLSGGMKRRAEIARGLVHYPKVLFLDEPTTGLDPQTRANIWDYIHALQKEKGMTIFLTTHYMDEAEICDTVAIIDHGTIVAFDPPHRLKKRFTTDTVKIRTAEGEALAGFLAGRSIPYQLHEGLFTIRSRNVSEALELASRFRSSITDLEIHKGTLNEVFIAVTGKEIRH